MGYNLDQQLSNHSGISEIFVISSSIFSQLLSNSISAGWILRVLLGLIYSEILKVSNSSIHLIFIVGEYFPITIFDQSTWLVYIFSFYFLCGSVKVSEVFFSCCHIYFRYDQFDCMYCGLACVCFYVEKHFLL